MNDNMNLIEIANKYHTSVMRGLRILLREVAKQADKSCFPFPAMINTDNECDVVVDIIDIRQDGNDVTIEYIQNNEKREDCIELFSYDELYSILCNLCKRL